MQSLNSCFMARKYFLDVHTRVSDQFSSDKFCEGRFLWLDVKRMY